MAEVAYVGRPSSIEERLARHAGLSFLPIQVGGIRGLAPGTALQNAAKLLRSVGRAREIIRSFKPDVIFCTGGYVSAPAVWAGAAEHVPTLIYLPDLEPGWAIRATAQWATCVAVSFDQVTKYFRRAVVTGYPVRRKFFEVRRIEARQHFRLDPNARTVTIFGGSQGAHQINVAVVKNLVALAHLTQAIHITGRNDHAGVLEQVRSLPDALQARVRVFDYLDEELPDALAAADVAVARAGAGTLGEFPALGLPALLVPYPHAGRHQELNARFLTDAGAAVRIEDAHLEGELVPTLKHLFEAPEQLKSMAQAARSLCQPHAAERIAELLRTLAKECA